MYAHKGKAENTLFGDDEATVQRRSSSIHCDFCIALPPLYTMYALTMLHNESVF